MARVERSPTGTDAGQGRESGSHGVLRHVGG